MSYYGYDKFVHRVPAPYVIPAHTPMRRVEAAPNPVETFFTLDYDLPVPALSTVKFYLTYDITVPKPPEEKIASVIYNVIAVGNEFPVAVYQGSRLWSAFSDSGQRTTLYTSEIESFDTSPSRGEQP